jgi:hypothetical protein
MFNLNIVFQYQRFLPASPCSPPPPFPDRKNPQISVFTSRKNTERERIPHFLHMQFASKSIHYVLLYLIMNYASLYLRVSCSIWYICTCVFPIESGIFVPLCFLQCLVYLYPSVSCSIWYICTCMFPVVSVIFIPVCFL